MHVKSLFQGLYVHLVKQNSNPRPTDLKAECLQLDLQGFVPSLFAGCTPYPAFLIKVVSFSSNKITPRPASISCITLFLVYPIGLSFSLFCLSVTSWFYSVFSPCHYCMGTDSILSFPAALFLDIGRGRKRLLNAILSELDIIIIKVLI